MPATLACHCFDDAKSFYVTNHATWQSKLTFAPSFPGKLSRRPLYLSNTIERPVVLDSVKSSNPAFSVVLTARIVEAKSKNVEIGYVDFKPHVAASYTCERRRSGAGSGPCDPFGFDTDDHFGEPVTAQEYRQAVDLNRRFSALMNGQGTVEKTTLSLKTSVTMRVSTVEALASLTMPTILSGQLFQVLTFRASDSASTLLIFPVFSFARRDRRCLEGPHHAGLPVQLGLRACKGESGVF